MLLCNPARPKFGYVGNVLIYNFWNNDFDVIRKGNFAELFVEQMLAEDITLDHHHPIIYDCCNEGISPADINLAVASLEAHDITLNIGVLFNITVAEDLPYPFRCSPSHFSAHCGFVNHIRNSGIIWEELVIERTFIALMRRASVGRAQLAKCLLDRFTHNTFLMSCGSQPNRWVSTLTNLKEAIHPYTLPILLDGITDDYKDQHYHVRTDFFTCLINIAVETSSQTDADSWREVFISEKSLKPFAYRQLPIWFAVPGTVQEVRNLGFDVFDDIIDHDYDIIEDPTTRMLAMVRVLHEFEAAHSITDMNSLRHTLWPRINKNVDVLYDLNNKHPQTKHTLIMELINEF
jgi:hypothetical protein